MPRPTQPFWIHQAAEYALGLALVSFGARSLTPLVPCALGGVILLNAAIVRGPLAAFRGVPRKVHRILDLAVVGLAVLAAIQPVLDVEPGARGLCAVVGGALGVLWWQTNFAEPVPRRWRVPGRSAEPPGDPPVGAGEPSAPGDPTGVPAGERAAELGRNAGRAVGAGVNAVRRRARR